MAPRRNSTEDITRLTLALTSVPLFGRKSTSSACNAFEMTGRRPHSRHTTPALFRRALSASVECGSALADPSLSNPSNVSKPSPSISIRQFAQTGAREVRVIDTLVDTPPRSIVRFADLE